VNTLRVAGLLLAAWVLGSSASQSAEQAPDPDRRLLASFLMTESAHRGPIKRKTGFEFYVVAGKGVGGPFLEAAQFRDGKVVDTLDWGSSSAEIEAIERVGLVPFDFDREVEKADERGEREAVARGEHFFHGSRDGATWEVVIVTSSGRFSMHAGNPTSEIDALAPYSENLAKLKAVIDLLTHYYGSYKLGF